MMIDSRFRISWIGYCEYNNKLWACFTDAKQETPLFTAATRYCIWGMIGKKLSINSHASVYNHPTVYDIKRRKMENGYVEINIDTLIAMWPNFFEELNRKFIWAKLSEQI